MAETNSLTTIHDDTRKKVKAARENIGKLRDSEGLTPAQMNLVDSAYSVLVDLEDLLVLEELKTNVKSLRSKSAKLSKITTRMKKSIKALKKVAKLVEDAAKAVGGLADIFAKASSAGIL
jgi:outer membrane murein-binding lipoprotein Lpp